ncbi:tetratricopeptide repeat protein [Massilia sp. W12]|uniref:tetratricopeptide repeat protein n=1 Tax=Massilia sp. W12 TaxID=3126507 RepID=UPI0030D2938B
MSDLAEFEPAIRTAAQSLPPECFDDFRRIARSLRSDTKHWALYLLKFSHRQQQQAVSQALQSLFGAFTQVQAMGHADWLDLEQTLRTAAQAGKPIEITDLDQWLEDYPDPAQADRRMGAWNIQRESCAASIPVPMLCWLRAPRLRALATRAPDLWSWKRGLYVFCEEDEAKPQSAGLLDVIRPNHKVIDNRSGQDKQARLAEIQQYLAQTGEEAGDALRWNLLYEQADLLIKLGQPDAALRLLRDELLPLARQDQRQYAFTMGQIADVLQARGEWDEALRIRREEELPVYTALGDQRARAVTMDNIADVLQARGEWDEALRIRREEELPVYTALGDQRARAVTMDKIADDLQARGEWDEALHIRREEVLPAFESLSDQHARAVAMGKIADVLQARGEWDEALRIYREELLPAFESLGDQRARAVTMGKIANVLQARGEWDEALRIRREEELPIFEQLADKRELSVSRFNLALLLLKRGHAADRPEALRLLQQSLAADRELRIPEADYVAQTLQQHFPDQA